MTRIRGTTPPQSAAPQPQDGGQQQTLNADQALDIAAQYLGAGDLTSAQVLCNRILEKWANHPVAINMLGIIAYHSGNNDDAAGCFSQAINIRPEYADAHYNLGNALKALGRLEEAIPRYLKTLELQPDHFDAHYNLGNTNKALGRPDQALENYQRALQLKPDFSDAHNNSGNVLKTSGKLDQALACYQKAVHYSPDYAVAHYNLGTTLQALDRPAEAIAHYQKAITIRPDLAVAHNNLGTALRVTGRLEEALSHYQQATSLQPGFTSAHNNLAALYERTNQLELAQESNKRALGISPDDADAGFIKALLLRRRGDTDQAITALEALNVDALSENYRARRYFELGKSLDSQGESERAFNAYSRGNLLHSQSAAAAQVDKDRYRSKIGTLHSVLKPEWVRSWTPPVEQRDEPAPIFLVGFPRSGTTLLDQILGSHPRIQVMEERPVWADVERSVQAMPGGYPGALPGLTEVDICGLRQQYLEVVGQHFTLGQGQLFVDKRPMNTEYLPLIKRLFPDASILFACRHPCDVVLSNFMQYYNPNDAMANFFSLEDTVHLYQQMMKLWFECNELLGFNAHTVRYESLVSDLDAELSKLFSFLEVEWDESVLDFHQRAAGKDIINTPSYEQVTRPIYTEAMHRWHNYRQQLEPFMQELEPFLQMLGYAEGA